MTRQSKCFVAVLVAALLLTSGCFKSKTKVFKLDVNRDLGRLDAADRARLLSELKKRDGAIYRLPLTVVVATVPMKKTVKGPGDYERFAPCFFSKEEADERTTAESTAFTLGRVAFETTGEPDPDETYVVQTGGSFFESKSLLMEYTPDLRLTKGEAETKNEGIEFASKAAKTVIGIATRAAMNLPGAGLKGRADDEASRFDVALDAKKCYELIQSYEVV